MLGVFWNSQDGSDPTLFSEIRTPLTRLGPLSCACSRLGHILLTRVSEPALAIRLRRAGLSLASPGLEAGLRGDHQHVGPLGRSGWTPWADQTEGRREKRRGEARSREMFCVLVGPLGSNAHRF